MADAGVFDDGTSKLPEHIRHHVLSFLKPKEAAKTSVLSKAWLRTWRSRPNLHFKYDEEGSSLLSRRDVTSVVVGERRTNFINCINTTLLRHHENKYRIDSLKIDLERFEFPSLTPDHINTWLKIAADSGVRSLQIGKYSCNSTLPQTIFEAKSLVKLCLMGQLQLKPQVIKMIRCHDLKNLFLSVDLDEEMFQKIMSSCPLIEILNLRSGGHLVNVKVNKLLKLKQCSIVMPGNGYVEVEAPSLEAFDYHKRAWLELGSESLPCRLHMHRCENLKKLALDEIAITDEDFLGIAEKFPHLESLIIQDCHHLQNMKISSRSIKRIRLGSKKELKEFLIDVPTIVRFEWRGCSIPQISFTAGSCPKVSDIELQFEEFNILDTSFFPRLKEFLTKLNQSRVSLQIFFPANVEGFTEDEMKNIAIFPLPQVQKLSIVFDQSDCLDAAYLVMDGLLWTCRPKTIVLDECIWALTGGLTFKDNDVVKVLFEMLMLRRDHNHSNLQQAKFWQQDLKDVRLEVFGRKGRQRLQQPQFSDWETFWKAISPVAEGFYLVFKLEWEAFDKIRNCKRDY